MNQRRTTSYPIAQAVALGLLAGLALLAAPARADDFGRDRHEEGREHHEEAREHREFARERHIFHEHDVHRFGPEELGRWRAGEWRNSCFAGRCGWWWLAGGQWYFYERPIYPYPLIVSDVTFIEPLAPAPVLVVPPPAPAYVPAAPAYVAPAPPVVVAPAPPPPPPAQVYYYCDNPPGYYPTVPRCATPFRAVPAPR